MFRVENQVQQSLSINNFHRLLFAVPTMSDSSDSDFVDGFARSNAAQYQRRNNGNNVDPRNLPGPSGVVPRRAPQRSNVATDKRSAKTPVPRIDKRPEHCPLSEWLIQEMPQKTYFPQIGDDVMYFRQGHEIYLSIVRRKYPKYYDPEQPVPWSSLNLSDQESCRVINVEFVLRPSRMCKLQLRRTKNRSLTDDSFTICYHPVPEAMDFLVLRDVYSLGFKKNWQVGQRFRCAMPNNTWRRGVIIAIGPLDQRFRYSNYLRYKVRWDDGTVSRVSQWDLVSNNHESTVSPRFASIAVQREDLDAWQGVLRGSDWPLGDRDLFLERIAPKLELLLELLICEPFVDAQHERTDPAYLGTVAYPVDIGLILLRLDSGFYRRISSVRFDITHMLYNALRFYTPSHSFAKIARLSTDLLIRIIRDCRRNIPLKIMYRQSLDAVYYTETETDEENQTVTRKKKIKRLRKPRLPPNYQIVLKSPRANRPTRPKDENRPPIIQDISNNVIPQNSANSSQRSTLQSLQPRILKETGNSEIHDGKNETIIQVNCNSDNQLTTSHSKKLDEVQRWTKHVDDCLMKFAKAIGLEDIYYSTRHLKEPEWGISNHSLLSKNKENNEQLISSRRSQKRSSGQVSEIVKANEHILELLSTRFPSPVKHGNDKSRSPSLLQVNGDNENQSLSISSYQQEPGNIKIQTKNNIHPEKYLKVESHASSSCPQERISVNGSTRAILPVSDCDRNRPSTSRQDCGISTKDRPRIRTKDRPRRLFVPPVIIEFNRTREQQRVSKRKNTRRRIILEERNIDLIRSSENACSTLLQGKSIYPSESPRVCNGDWNGPSISRSQERVLAPTPFFETEWNQPSTSQAHVSSDAAVHSSSVYQQNHPESSRSEECTHTTPSVPGIDQNHSTSSRFQKGTQTVPSVLRVDQDQECIHSPALDCEQPNHLQKYLSKKDSNLEQNVAITSPQRNTECITSVRKSSIKRPKETSSSESATPSSSDSDTPVLSIFKGTPKRARMHKISKMKEWRADSMRVLQALWDDEDAAMFRESAMENHRRSVIEWISLEYIMDLLKSGVYKDPFEVVDEVQTMLLHGRSLIYAGNEDIGRTIDKLSLLFDELIDPILRKWTGFNDEEEEEGEREDCRDRQETESVLTIDEITSSSSAVPESSPPQSPT